MLAGRAEYVHQYAVATKRLLHALLKAVNFCVSEPELVARRMVHGGFATNYDHALRTLSDTHYDRWREFDPEDTMRFFALRMSPTRSSPRAPTGAF
jgi:NitT/TauT family transport system substrate-binding protein